MPQRCRTAGPWRYRRLVSTWLVEAKVNGVLVPVAAFTWEADARAVVEMVNLDLRDQMSNADTGEPRDVGASGVRGQPSSERST